MRYLGRISGDGMLLLGGEDVARVSLEFEGFARPRGEIACSGEIAGIRAVMETVFGTRGLQLRTDDHRLLDLRFTAKALGKNDTSAQVDVSGELPATAAEWAGAPAPAPAV